LVVFLIDRFQRKRLLEREHALAKEKELVHAREIEKAFNKLKTTQLQLIQS
jgi:RecA-family ATPase